MVVVDAVGRTSEVVEEEVHDGFQETFADIGHPLDVIADLEHHVSQELMVAA